MLRGNRELWWAIAVGILITTVFGAVMFFTRAIPAAGELFGHGLGILGFILMLMTETLYSLRKRRIVQKHKRWFFMNGVTSWGTQVAGRARRVGAR